MLTTRVAPTEKQLVDNFALAGLSQRFSVVRTLGVGSTGVVVEVVDRLFTEQHLAIKILHRHLLADPAVFARFRNEVLLARQLSHPNITRFYDFEDIEQKLSYVSMELVRGCTLRALFTAFPAAPGRLPRAIDILVQLLHALQHAHSRSVLHRDINPQNVLIDVSGAVKLSDFGLAHALDTDSGLTKTGDAAGSPAYMSPEQFTGRPLSPASDLYSLGILAFEMLTGRLPFTSESYYLLAKEHLNTPLPLQQFQHFEIPSWLTDLVLQLTAKNPEDRPASAAKALEIVQSHWQPNPSVRAGLGADASSEWNRLHKPNVPLRTRIIAHVMWFLIVLGVPVFVLAFPNSKQHLLMHIMILELEFGRRLPWVEYYSPSPEVSLLSGRAVVDAIKRSDRLTVGAWCRIGVFDMRPDQDGDLISHHLARRPELMPWAFPCLLAEIYDLPNVKGETPVMVATRHGYTDSVELLLERNFRADLADKSGIVPIEAAIISRNRRLIRTFIDAQPHISQRFVSGKTPIHAAVATGEVDVVKEILHLGLDVNQRDRLGSSALMAAVALPWKQAEPIVTELIRAGVDTDALDNQGRTYYDFIPAEQTGRIQALIAAALTHSTMAGSADE